MARHRKRKRDPRPVRVYPLPEAVSGGKAWKVGEARGVPYADVTNRTMAIPTAADKRAAAIRLHEMGHARWTPANCGELGHKAGLEHWTVNACEDARIQRRLSDAGFPLDSVLNEAEQNTWRERFEDGQIRALDAARLLIASIGTRDEWLFTELTREAGMVVVEQVTRRIWREQFGKRRPSVQRMLDAAEELERWFRDPPDEEAMESLDLPDFDAEEPVDEAGVEWGAMQIVEPKRTLRLPPRIRAPKRRATPEGSFPRNWHRLPVDGAVFAKRAKRPAGGSVLIDQSGSMSFTPADVLAILEAAPAATVATYAGNDYTGELRILARDGMRVADDLIWIYEGNNTVDGPALQWLARQDGPRFWVSDGRATAPVGGHGNAVAEAARIALHGRIRRVPTMADLIADAI